MRDVLKIYLTQNGVKQKYIAKKLGISESMLSHYLKGRKQLGKQKLLKLKQIIN